MKGLLSRYLKTVLTHFHSSPSRRRRAEWKEIRIHASMSCCCSRSWSCSKRIWWHSLESLVEMWKSFIVAAAKSTHGWVDWTASDTSRTANFKHRFHHRVKAQPVHEVIEFHLQPRLFPEIFSRLCSLGARQREITRRKKVRSEISRIFPSISREQPKIKNHWNAHSETRKTLLISPSEAWSESSKTF